MIDGAPINIPISFNHGSRKWPYGETRCIHCVSQSPIPHGGDTRTCHTSDRRASKLVRFAGIERRRMRLSLQIQDNCAPVISQLPITVPCIPQELAYSQEILDFCVDLDRAGRILRTSANYSRSQE